MFNLLMSGHAGDWDLPDGHSGNDTFSLSRFLEYTEASLEGRFKPVTPENLRYLEQLPTVFMSEQQYDHIQQRHFIKLRIGRIFNLGIAGSDILFSYHIERNFGEINITDQRLFEKAFQLGRWEISRTHWAIKAGELAHSFAMIGLPLLTPEPAATVPLPPTSNIPWPVASSLEGFLAQVLKLGSKDGEEVFYRGHSNRKYQLVPTLFRKNDDGEFRHLRKEDVMVRELQSAQSKEFDKDRYMLDQLVRMQHFGLPTRLLDITSNPLIALYFACSGNGLDQDGEVIIMTTPTTDVMFFDSDKVSCIANLCLTTDAEKNRMDAGSSESSFNETTEGKKLLHYIRREKPNFEGKIKPSDLNRILFVRGRNTHERIISQSGAFLLFGKDAVLPETGHSTLNVQRIVIKNKDKILDDLAKLNIKSSTVYPGIDKAAGEIARKHETR